VTDPSPLVGPPVASANELLARLQAFQTALAADDGLACFARMYVLVTDAIGHRLSASAFADSAWMSHLDVVFGNIFLDAVRASVQAPDQIARAWKPLLQQRADTQIRPLQFALAGLNAHINRDLPLAIVQTCVDLGTSPQASPHHADFFRVNAALAEVEPTIRANVEGAFLADADRLIPGLQDLVGNFNLVKARETAWTSAETLWLLRQYAADHGDAYTVAMDRSVGLAARVLLVRLTLAS
jgi:Family of unknown function (DUF5995)